MRREPLRRQVRRVLTVARRVGLHHELRPTRLPAALKVMRRAGLSTRSVHRLQAALAPDRVALRDGVRTLTWREAEDEIDRLSRGLATLGVGPGTPVLILMENRVEYVIAWFALQRVAARVVHGSYRLVPAELRFLVDHSGARTAIVGEAARETAVEVARERPLRLVHLGPEPSTPEAIRWPRVLRDAAATLPDAPADARSESVVYTSGTTGRPKGAARDLGRMGIVELSRILERLPLRVHDRHLVVTPLYHSGAQAMALLATALGNTLLLDSFDPVRTIVRLRDDGVHALFLVPTMLRRLLDHPVPPLPELRGVLSGASEFPHSLRVRAIEAFGAEKVFDFYGATELGWVTLVDGREMLARPGTVGRPLDGVEIAILGPDGQKLPPGEVGLVCVRTAQEMEGYVDDPSATAEAHRRGYATVEDLGWLDAGGYLFLAGRERDMVKSGGVNLYPVEIEEVLLQHPSIREVAVIGVPDAEWGEALVGVVVPRGAFDPAAVEAFARTQLAGPKVPRRWEVVDELPRNALGKVLKKDLRSRHR